ncbi:hypothetical protein HRU87_02280 [Aquiluna borgnonia]|uniref:Uncharacterized protein n=1 Tax=Aquiluna borgnonia TaxID=2499157 RepID=A0A7D4QFX5_9MICO|nr:hypothetical protein [Aquiluna borgnonia]QKJ25048.1 hypothetical protein HRU87_02280 [Aquiluna borgnonia]
MTVQKIDSKSENGGTQPLRVVSITDSGYASRCAVMLESSGVGDLTTVLSLDEGVHRLLQAFPKLQVTDWNEFLRANPAVARSIKGRSRAESIFSVGPSFLLSQVDQVDPEGWLVYADADLFFFSSMVEYLNSHPRSNVVISPHRHHAWNVGRLAKYGKYNVGLVAFRNNSEGIKALKFWAKSCLEWCKDKPENGKYADQKYLESFAKISQGVFEDYSRGVNLAPWNSWFTRVSRNVKGELYAGDKPLVYFHAQGLRRTRRSWVLGHLNYFALANYSIRRFIYTPYVRQLEGWNSRFGLGGNASSRSPLGAARQILATLNLYLSLLLRQTIASENMPKESRI